MEKTTDEQTGQNDDSYIEFLKNRYTTDNMDVIAEEPGSISRVNEHTKKKTPKRGKSNPKLNMELKNPFNYEKRRNTPRVLEAKNTLAMNSDQQSNLTKNSGGKNMVDDWSQDI